MTLGDRLVVMNDGVVQQLDTPARVYEQPANRFVAGFVGTPSMNFIEGALEDSNRFVGEGVSIQLPDNLAGSAREAGLRGACTLGVRPDALEPTSSAEGSIACSIEAIEYLGDRVDLVLGFDGGQLVCRSTPTGEYSEGDSIKVALGGPGVHLFAPGALGARV